MPFGDGPVPKQILLVVAIVLSLSARSAVVSHAAEKLAGQQSSAQAPAAARPVGTIKSISGNTIVLTTDAGADVIIQVQDPAQLVRIAPGQKDLKDVTPIQLADLQPGDRILVRGKLADDGKSVAAASVIAIKKADIAEKQSHERKEWQRHGFGGLVSNVDADGNTINASLPSPDERKTGAIHYSKASNLLRYAPARPRTRNRQPSPMARLLAGRALEEWEGWEREGAPAIYNRRSAACHPSHWRTYRRATLS